MSRLAIHFKLIPILSAVLISGCTDTPRETGEAPFVQMEFLDAGPNRVIDSTTD